MNDKLYKVILRGFNASDYKVGYVVASHPTEAYETMANMLDSWNVGFKWEKELYTVELIAEDSRYPECGTRLFISD